MFKPPVFHETPKDIGNWLLLYERTTKFNRWDGTRSEQVPVHGARNNAQKWYIMTLRGMNAPTTWDT